MGSILSLFFSDVVVIGSTLWRGRAMAKSHKRFPLYDTSKGKKRLCPSCAELIFFLPKSDKGKKRNVFWCEECNFLYPKA